MIMCVTLLTGALICGQPCDVKRAYLDNARHSVNETVRDARAAGVYNDPEVQIALKHWRQAEVALSISIQKECAQ